MMPAIRMSINKEIKIHAYKPPSSVDESVGNVKLHTTTLIKSDARVAVIVTTMNCIIIAYKPMTR